MTYETWRVWRSNCLRYLKHRDRLRQAQGDLYRAPVLKTGAQGTALSNISLGVLRQDQHVFSFLFALFWLGWLSLLWLFCSVCFEHCNCCLLLPSQFCQVILVRLSFWVSNHHRVPGRQLSKLDFVGRYWRGESLQNILHLSNTYLILMINTTNAINVVLVPGLNRIFQLACFDIGQESPHLERVCVKIIYWENNDKPNVSPSWNPQLPRVSSKLSWPRSEDASGCAFHVAVLVFEGAWPAVTTEPSCVYLEMGWFPCDWLRIHMGVGPPPDGVYKHPLIINATGNGWPPNRSPKKSKKFQWAVGSSFVLSSIHFSDDIPVKNCKGWSWYFSHDMIARNGLYRLHVWGNLKTKLFDKPKVDLVDS